MGINREACHTAQKAHWCWGCNSAIQPKTFYVRLTCQNEDGTPISFAYHPDCLEHERLLCRQNGLRETDEEWMPLHEHVAEGGIQVLEGASPEVHQRFQE